MFHVSVIIPQLSCSSSPIQSLEVREEQTERAMLDVEEISAANY